MCDGEYPRVKQADNTVRCPRCGYPQYCPCDSCKKLLPKGINPWVWVDASECNGLDGVIECAGCGYRNHEDFWLELCMKHVKN